MAQDDGSAVASKRFAALRGPLFFGAVLAAALIVPAGVSSATPPTAEGTLEPLPGEHIEAVGDLVLVADPAPFGPVAAEGLGLDDPGTAEAATTFSEAFALHSRPDATRKIFLDFDGEVVVNANWNGGNPIDAAAYSRGDQSNEAFSTTDLDAIAAIWARVSEDFAVWDVDVTTEDPGTAGLARTGSGDVDYGVRVVITPTYQWYSSERYGGVAYLHTFDRFEDLPAWVFSGNLGNGSTKSVAEAISHEVGHTLGLSHDGVSSGDATSAYYSGHGDWAPIMGVGYYKDVTQWSKGEYPGATTTEDDMAIIDSYLPRLSAAATASAAASGIIGPGPSTTTHTIIAGGAANDHAISVESGPVTVSVNKADADGNLLAELRLYDTGGKLIATSAPSNPAQWSLEVTLPAGTASGLYTAEVTSVGWTPADNPGFTSYASVGRYELQVDAPAADPDLDPRPEPEPEPEPNPTAPPPTPDTPDSAGDRLTAITPRRVLDTRSTSSALTGPLRAGQDSAIVIEGVPSDASAVIVNLTAVAPQSTGFFSLTPCGVAGDARTSSLNFTAGRNVANSVIVPVATPGRLCLFSSVEAHALLDLTGWLSPSGELSLEQLDTVRIVDSRENTGVSGRLSAGVRTPISLSSSLASDNVDAVALNVTAIRPSDDGFLTIDDCSSGEQTSSLNFVSGEIRGNNGVFALGAGQQLCITSSAATDVTIDVTGDFSSDPGLTFVANTTPERILDTRQTGRLDAGETATFGVATEAGANALSRPPLAVSVNLTAARHDANGFVTAWSCGTRPETSALNPSAGSTTANGALVELSQTGTSCLFHQSGGHLIVDLAGWWI